jgi:hypothetical protein
MSQQTHVVGARRAACRTVNTATFGPSLQEARRCLACLPQVRVHKGVLRDGQGACSTPLQAPSRVELRAQNCCQSGMVGVRVVVPHAAPSCMRRSPNS